MKTYGKHEVSMLNVEQKEDNKLSAGENIEGKTANDKDGTNTLAQKSISALINIPLLNSPTQRKHTLLQPSGVKLPTPPAVLLNGTKSLQNIHKSASTSSLQKNLDRTVPNAEQMLLAAQNRKKEIEMASPRAIGARLPPLQLQKSSKMTEGEEIEVPEKGTDRADPKMDEQRRQGMIATMATRPLPQLHPQGQSSRNYSVNSPILPPPPPPPYMATDPSAHLSTSLPVTKSIANVPKEVLVHLQNPPRRRASSAGAIAANAHKPLPAISDQIGTSRNGTLFRGGASAKKRPNFRIPCGKTAKCVLVGVFFSVPVIIFALVMLFSEGFAPHSSDAALSPNQSVPPSTVASSATANPTLAVPVPTDVNIVGGAIFQPISMQNASGGTTK